MIKHKFLRDVRFDKGLKLFDGSFAHNYHELLVSLKLLSDDEFNEEVSLKNEHVINWVRENYGDQELVEKLKQAKSRKKYVFVLEKHIKKLEREAEELSGLLEKRERIKRRKSQIFPYVWFAVYGVLIALLFLQHSYYYILLEETNSELFVKSTSLSDALSKNSELQAEISLLQSDKKTVLSLNEELLSRNRDLAARLDSLYAGITPGPRDRIPEESILVEPGKVSIIIDNPFISKFTDTKSMLPVLNIGANAVQIVPLNHSNIIVGDILSYESYDGRIIIHRVIETGFDNDGWYAITKGDGVRNPDPEKVRFSQVRRVLVAIIY